MTYFQIDSLGNSDGSHFLGELLVDEQQIEMGVRDWLTIVGDILDASRHRFAVGLVVRDRVEGDIFDGSILAKVDKTSQSVCEDD